MYAQSQPAGSQEVNKGGKIETQESNLSPTAQLVNEMMKGYIMPVLRDEGLVAKANEIIRLKLQPDDPKVIEFSLACREKQAEIYAKAQEDGCEEKKLAVVSNYFGKMISSVKSSSSSEPTPPEAATQVA